MLQGLARHHEVLLAGCRTGLVFAIENLVTRITVDDRVTVKATASNGDIFLEGGTALKVAREFARGRVLNITQGGTLVAQPSLAGASAALRYMDARQGRDGGMTALVARGLKPASAIKPPPAMPIVTAAPVPAANGFEEMLPEDIKHQACEKALELPK